MNVKELVKALTHIEWERRSGLEGYKSKIFNAKSVKVIEALYEEVTAVYEYLKLSKWSYAVVNKLSRDEVNKLSHDEVNKLIHDEMHKLDENYLNLVHGIYRRTKELNTKRTSAND